MLAMAADCKVGRTDQEVCVPRQVDESVTTAKCKFLRFSHELVFIAQ